MRRPARTQGDSRPPWDLPGIARILRAFSAQAARPQERLYSSRGKSSEFNLQVAP